MVHVVDMVETFEYGLLAWYWHWIDWIIICIDIGSITCIKFASISALGGYGSLDVRVVVWRVLINTHDSGCYTSYMIVFCNILDAICVCSYINPS